MLNCRNKNIKINELLVQTQTNDVNCGLFALAFCSKILLQNSNPVGIYFQEDKLRSHSFHCLAADKVTEFPKSTKESFVVKNCFIQTCFVAAICHGRKMRKTYEKQMTECCSCKEWSRRMCERIPDKVFSRKYPKIEWLCLKCKDEKDQVQLSIFQRKKNELESDLIFLSNDS